MGEHFTWTQLIPGLHGVADSLQSTFKRETAKDLFPTAFDLTHVWWTLLVLAIISYGAMRFHGAMQAKGGGIIPPKKFNARTLFEMLCDTVFGLMSQVMGEKNARRFLPLIGSLALFILFSNLCALIPGFGVPTTTLKTNLALALLVFVIYNVVGMMEHGVWNYLKHFAGPIPALAPLMIPIEIISHLARPLSLAIRLLGNMSADHKVVFTFATLVPLVVPVPFLFLGLLVSIVQTLVFCLLTMVYISMAVAHDH